MKIVIESSARTTTGTLITKRHSRRPKVSETTLLRDVLGWRRGLLTPSSNLRIEWTIRFI